MSEGVSPLPPLPVAEAMTNKAGQPPRSQYPEHPLPQPKKTPAQLAQLKNRTKIVPPANYGNPRGGLAPGLQGGTGGKETLSDLGLVPQSVLMIKFGEEEMNGGFWVILCFLLPANTFTKALIQPLSSHHPLVLMVVCMSANDRQLLGNPRRFCLSCWNRLPLYPRRHLR